MKYIKILSLVALALVLNACEQDFEDDRFRPRDRTTGWVQFSTSSDQAFNNGNEFKIPFDVNVPINPDGIAIDYNVEVVSGTAPEGVAGSFTENIEPDERETSASITLNPEFTSNFTLKYTITNVDDEDISVGIEGSGRPVTFTLEVCDTTFPLTWNGTTFIEGSEIGTFTMNLTPTSVDNEYTIDTAWGDFVADATGDPSFIGQFPYSGTLVLNDDNTVEIISDNAEQLPGGEGVFDPCANSLEYSLEQALFNGDFLVDVVLTPAN